MIKEKEEEEEEEGEEQEEKEEEEEQEEYEGNVLHRHHHIQTNRKKCNTYRYSLTYIKSQQTDAYMQHNYFVHYQSLTYQHISKHALEL